LRAERRGVEPAIGWHALAEGQKSSLAVLMPA
jgi:hypothetical protein